MKQLNQTCTGLSLFDGRLKKLKEAKQAWAKQVSRCEKAALIHREQNAPRLLREMIAQGSPLILWCGGKWEEAIDEMIEAIDETPEDVGAHLRHAVVTFTAWADYNLNSSEFREPDVEFSTMKYTDGEKEDLKGDIANRDEFDPEDYIDWNQMRKTLDGDQDGLSGTDVVEFELCVFTAKSGYKPKEESLW